MARQRSTRLPLALLLLVPLSLAAQDRGAPRLDPAPQRTEVPRTIRFSGVLQELSTSHVSAAETLRFTLYQDPEGAKALWTETQVVTVAPQGRYTVLLGAESEDGIPQRLFSSTEARWLGVRLEGQHEHPPVMLVSVPYALKAADAETLGGWPASAFLRAEGAEASGAPAPPGAPSDPARLTPKVQVPILGWGPKDAICKFTGAGTIGPSVMFDNGFVGVKSTSPRTELDVNGTLTVKNRLTLAQDLGTSTPTWSIDNSASRFRLFRQPTFNANGIEVLTADLGQVNVLGALDVSGDLDVGGNLHVGGLSTGIGGLRTHEITFPPELPDPLATYYRIESLGPSLKVFFHYLEQGALVPYPVFTLQGGGLGIFNDTPRTSVDIWGEVLTTTRFIMAQDTGTTTPTWNIDNNESVFRLYHQPDLHTSGEAVMVATLDNHVGIGAVYPPTHTLDVGGDLAIVGAGHRLIFPDGTVQTSAVPAGAFFGVCTSNSAGPQTCSCLRVLSQTQISAGESCSISGVPGNCTAVSQTGPPITYGACCVCN